MSDEFVERPHAPSSHLFHIDLDRHYALAPEPPHHVPGTRLLRISPESGCPGDVVTLSGWAFVEPDVCEVYFEGVPAEVLSIDIQGPDPSARYPWDVTLVARVPDLPPRAGEAQIAVTFTGVIGTTTVQVGAIDKNGQISVHRSFLPTDIYDCEVGTSFTWRPVGPEIGLFAANGTTSATVAPGQKMGMDWLVRNATSVAIVRTSAVGPEPPTKDFHAAQRSTMSGSMTLPAFAETEPVDAVYTLTATNETGQSVSAVVTSRLRQTPKLRILGIEIVQTIQRFTLDPAKLVPGTNVRIPLMALNNSVPAVSRKRTVARVYVDSGVSSGFGGNAQGNVTGRVNVLRAGGAQWRGAGSPLDDQGVITAQPWDDSLRGDLKNSLNFELPCDELDGSVTVDARVWVSSDFDKADHRMDSPVSGWSSELAIAHTFFPKRSLQVQPVLVADGSLPNLGIPSLADYMRGLQEARTCFPIAENGFIVRPPVYYETNSDLTTNSGWYGLMLDIYLLSSGRRDPGEIWTALVPRSPSYTWGGMGIPYFDCLVVQANIVIAFGHELGHVFWLNHSLNPAPGQGTPPPWPIDSRLPPTTEDIGIRVDTRTLMPTGRPELMSYGQPLDSRWPSIAAWGILFDEMS